MARRPYSIGGNAQACLTGRGAHREPIRDFTTQKTYKEEGKIGAGNLSRALFWFILPSQDGVRFKPKGRSSGRAVPALTFFPWHSRGYAEVSAMESLVSSRSAPGIWQTVSLGW